LQVLYLETSALLSWLFNEPKSSHIIEKLNGADLIVTSDLLRIETVRSVKRLRNEKVITDRQQENLLNLFMEHHKGWFRMSIDESVVLGATQNFPEEPVRSLDAIHLSTALEYKKLYPDLKMLTFDERLQKNIEALGL
jgi:predicted nucleic acid-binding protein